MSPLYLLFLGPAGSGKGTQAEKILETFGLCHLSTGDILRGAIRKETLLGKKAESYVEAGDLVPDSLIIDLIKETLTPDRIEKGFLFDGFPRTLEQGEKLKELLLDLGISLTHIFYFDISLEKTISRIAGRRICVDCNKIYHIDYNPPKTCGEDCSGNFIQRSDDTEEKVRHRYDVFEEQTVPLLSFYGEDLLSIDADLTPDEIHRELCLAIEGTKV